MPQNQAKHLIIKTSSLGDVVHMLPAISDAQKQIPELTFDWVVEKGFAEIPAWHPTIDTVIPVSIRQWRKSPLSKSTRLEFSVFKTAIKKAPYTKVIDAQGLIKSAVLTRFAQGEIWGYDKHSITEALASRFYHQCVSVPFKEHAITRNRLVLAKSLGYSIDNLELNYGIANNPLFQNSLDELQQNLLIPQKTIIALHGTSRKDKEWPIEHWDKFIKIVEQSDYTVLLPWGNPEEKSRAQHLVNKNQKAIILPPCSLTTLAGLIQNADAVIGMDTGLMHVAAAFDKKGVALYPATQPELTGVLSATQNIESIAGDDALDADAINAKMLALLSFG